MVGHTHQDFLPTTDAATVLPSKLASINLSQIKEFHEELELFDIPGQRLRKVNLSHLDEHIDNLDDWKRFIRPLIGIDCLYLINDRVIRNPIMREFSNDRNVRYLAQLQQDQIPAVIVDLQSRGDVAANHQPNTFTIRKLAVTCVW